MKSGFRIFKALDGGLDGGSSALGGPPRKTDNECGSRALGHNALALIIFVPLTMGVVHPEQVFKIQCRVIIVCNFLAGFHNLASVMKYC